MTKERRTVSIEKDVDEFLDQEGVNASELVNRLVKNHATAGGDEKGMLQLRREQLKSDISSLQSQLQEKESELERVNERLSKYKDETSVVIEDASEALRNTPLTENNDAVQHWAEKAGLHVSEFIERLKQYRDNST